MDDVVIVRSATKGDLHFASAIIAEIESSAKARGSGIAKRSEAYIHEKMLDEKAVIAVTPTNEWVGFIYMDTWSNGDYVSHCGLIVAPLFRRMGIATRLKEKIFELSRTRFPEARIFGITTTLATMRINSKLGLQPVTFSEIVQDAAFWDKCKSCVHYKDLCKAGFKNCFCTAMMFDPHNDDSFRLENKTSMLTSVDAHF
ncbi:GNAT family N-acetyltransferase [Niabella hibiscisoli]|uniref:GNAT family N-acetyltransferase n=1 Tax=Niabella hibiscisoli TaxID=1825928 RepID=UPI001F0F7428|nr:GNAT family N-acetyltransferase [Niabella hibiscisoli]MCH5717688.1 GNAT family N-acetyltransferase [Niabella hibiscisoli]